MTVPVLKNDPGIYLLLLFFAVYNDDWLNDVLGIHYYVLLLSVFVIVFLSVTGQWRRILLCYSPRRITARTLSVFAVVLLLIIVYRSLQFYMFKTGIRREMLDVVRNNGPVSVIPPLEDLFFIGIVFHVIRLHTVRLKIPSAGSSRERTLLYFAVPFLITFYWFLLPHRYSNHFLDPGSGFAERIRDFPVDILFGLFCGVYVFIRTRSLLLATLCHYMHNGLVWLYVTLYFPVYS